MPVSARPAPGSTSCGAALARAAGHVGAPGRRDAARLYVDRVFAAGGRGTVVTGTLWSGEVAVGDRLQVLPAGFELASAASQVHGRPSSARPPASASPSHLVPDRRGAGARPRTRRRARCVPGELPARRRARAGLRAPDRRGASTSATAPRPSRRRVVRIGGRSRSCASTGRSSRRAATGSCCAASTTVGGGRVLDPSPPAARGRVEARPARRGRSAGAPRCARRRAGAARSATGPGPARCGGARTGLGSLERAGEWVFAASWLAATRAAAAASVGRTRGRARPGPARGRAPRRGPLDRGEIAPLLAPGAARRQALPAGPPSGRRSAPCGGGSARTAARLGRPRARPAGRCRACAPARAGGRARAARRRPRDRRRRLRARAAAARRRVRSGGHDHARTLPRPAGRPARVAQLVLERLDADRVTLRVGETRRLRRSARPPGRV